MTITHEIIFLEDKKVMIPLHLKSIVKKITLYYTLAGAGIGITLFSVCIIGQNIPIYILNKAYYGVQAGLFGLLFSPIILAIMGFVHSVILWYPIMWIYQKIKLGTQKQPEM